MLAILVLALIVIAICAVVVVERRRVRGADAAQRETARLRRRFDAHRTTLADVRRAADRNLDPPGSHV